jgi:hypothetical protein
MINKKKKKFLSLYIDGQLLIEGVKWKKIIIKWAFIGGGEGVTTIKPLILK